MPKNMYEKIWEAHLVHESKGETSLIYIDRHFVHEVTSPQAFAALREAQRRVRCPHKTFATMDHNVSTRTKDIWQLSKIARDQIQTLQKNCDDYGIKLFDLNNPQQGIVHVVAPESGLTLPGMTIVCGDSHTATHGAFGALAFGIGTSEVEHVLATQTLQQRKSKTMLINVDGKLGKGVTAKDIILYVIGQIGTDGATGFIIEYAGSAIRRLSMEERMTVCNMTIEAGGRAGMIAPDKVTFDYLKGRAYAPKGKNWLAAVKYWKTLKTDKGAKFDKTFSFKAGELKPQVTWGTSPGQVAAVDSKIPNPKSFSDPVKRTAAENALKYMDLQPGDKLTDLPIDVVFIGSCTNGRIEDLQAAAKILKNRKVNPNVQTLVVPGSETVRREAERKGLDKIFRKAGCEWRFAGCSMCLAMNDDQLKPGQRCVSTSNRNFEGRQGPGGRTHLASPETAAASAIAGKIADVRKYLK